MTHYHFIGIGGTGLSPIARVLFERGDQISGSDMVMSPNAQELASIGVKVTIGHSKENITGADLVIRSSAIPIDNPEVKAALDAGISVMKRSDFLGNLTSGKKVIAVAGTHGKTTTSAMIAFMLTRLNLDPSYIVGSEVKNLKSNAHHGTGEFFVIEADEYDGMFLGLKPHLLIVTNLEHDHPDNYPTPESYFKVFEKLGQLITSNGMLLAEADNLNSHRLSTIVNTHHPTFLYGETEEVDYKITNINHLENCGVSFGVHFANKLGDEFALPRVSLQIPGRHNAHNATAAIACAHLIGLSSSDAALALEEFTGTGRRFDIRGEIQGITVIDDYAHHPTEIRATLAAARCKYADRPIWAVWQPHTFSRTQQLFNDFVQSFSDCDHVIVTEIYAAREKLKDFSSRKVVEAMHHPDARFVPDLRNCADILMQNLKSGDILLVMSAGDANQITTWVLNEFKRGLKHG